MHFRFLQFPKTSLEHTLSDSGLHPRVPDLAGPGAAHTNLISWNENPYQRDSRATNYCARQE